MSRSDVAACSPEAEAQEGAVEWEAGPEPEFGPRVPFPSVISRTGSRRSIACRIAGSPSSGEPESGRYDPTKPHAT